MMVDPRDTKPQGDPETVVYLPHGALVGLHIRGSGFGPTMLGIREDANGWPVSCAITHALTMESPAQSNPRRPVHGMGAVEDEDGA